MELRHIWGVTLRHIRLWTKDPNLIMMTFYWPLLDVLIWGFLGSWVTQIQQSSVINYESVFLFSILLWQTNCRACFTLVTGFIEELWSLNLINMFTLPLKLSEWIAGVTTFSFIMSIINAVYCILLLKLFYTISLAKILIVFALFGPALFITGIWLGFVSLHIIAYFGKRAQELAWVLAWGLSPICGVFYPINVFPMWLQKISYCIPMTYIFEGMREYVINGIFPTKQLLYGYGLGIIYAAIAVAIFVVIFNYSKTKGLTRLSD